MQELPVKSGTPSKNRENQDPAILTQSQPATVKEVEARVGQPATVASVDESEGSTRAVHWKRPRQSVNGRSATCVRRRRVP